MRQVFLEMPETLRLAIVRRQGEIMKESGQYISQSKLICNILSAALLDSPTQAAETEKAGEE